MLSKTVTSVLALVLIAACVGCPSETETPKESTDSGAATGPKTFREATEQLVEMKIQIRDGFAAGNVDAAHGPLHEVGHVLENLATLAKSADLSEEQLANVEQAKEKLFDAFGEIDKTLHGSEGSTYEEEAETIKASMKVIVEAAGVTDDSDANQDSSSADDGLPSGDGETVDAGSVSGGDE